MLNADLTGSARFGDLERQLEQLFQPSLENHHRAVFLAFQETDWKDLLHCAHRHNVDSLLPEIAGRHSVPLPAGVVETLHLHHQRRKLVWLHFQQALHEIGSAFAAVGIQIVFLKGPILAERIYAEPANRMSSDLDVLVAPEQFQPARETLEKLGYHLSGTPPEQLPQGAQKSFHELGFERKGSIPVELHFGVHEGFEAPFPTSTLFQRAAAYQSGTGLRTLVLEPEDEFLFLAVHAAGHRVARLAWLVDLVRFLEVYPRLDMELVFARAGEFRVKRALGFALNECRTRLGAQLPQPLEQRLGTNRTLAWLARRLPRETPQTFWEHFGTTIFTACLFDSRLSGLKFLSHQMMEAVQRRTR